MCAHTFLPVEEIELFGGGIKVELAAEPRSVRFGQIEEAFLSKLHQKVGKEYVLSDNANVGVVPEHLPREKATQIA